MEPNQWIGKINERNEALADLKARDKTEYLKLKLGLVHGSGNGPTKKKKKKKKR